MIAFFKVTQVVLSVLLIIAILAQQRGSGLSATFGGGGEVFTSKRGAEKVLFNATVILSVLFVLNSMVFLLIG